MTAPSPLQVPLRRTTLIILCEDGSLRIYVANTSTSTSTEYWLQPQFQPTSPLAVLRGHPCKKGGQIAKKQENLKFPIDFFEHCQLSQDVEVNNMSQESEHLLVQFPGNMVCKKLILYLD